MLNVPNLDSLQALWLGTSWPLLLPDFNYFNKSSLRPAAEKAGLRLVCLGSRQATFSLRYTAYCLRQHGVPPARHLEVLTVRSVFGEWMFPIYMGAISDVFVKP